MIDSPEEIISDLVEKMITLTADARIHCLQENIDTEEILNLFSRREKLIHIFESLYLKFEKRFHLDFKNQINQLINKIDEMDKFVLECLELEKEKTQIAIAKVFKNKENFKGYNLNTTK